MANRTGWFSKFRWEYPSVWSPNPLLQEWYGPFFSRNFAHEAICDEMCWSPSYSLSARIAGNTDPTFQPENYATIRGNASNWSNVTIEIPQYDAYTAVIVRITMQATVLVDVIRQIETGTRGEAFICTDDGLLVAAINMADAQTADMTTGEIAMTKAWEYGRPWASALDPNTVSAGEG